VQKPGQLMHLWVKHSISAGQIYPARPDRAAKVTNYAKKLLAALIDYREQNYIYPPVQGHAFTRGIAVQRII
jgi:hypothetical protein